MDNYNYAAAGGCSNCGGGAPTLSLAQTPMQPSTKMTQPADSQLPSIEDLAGFSGMTSAQQEQQRMQLAQSGSTLMPGMPGYRRQSGAGAEATVAPLTPTTAQMGAITGDNLQYLNGFLRTQIGRPVLVTFLVGTNTLTDRSGTLLGVGINYILINETQTDDVLACDFYNIKFVRFYY